MPVAVPSVDDLTQNFIIDIEDIEHLHHTRCNSFYLKQKERFDILKRPLNEDYLALHHKEGCIMMFTDSYLEARTIHHWFENNLSGIAASMIMYDTNGSEHYVILTTISMDYYETLVAKGA